MKRRITNFLNVGILTGLSMTGEPSNQISEGKQDASLNSDRSINTLEVTSKSFAENNYIPGQFTCDGENINPELKIGNIPKETKSLVLIVDDPDAPVKTWVHWIVWNIKPTGLIAQNSIPGQEGMNDFGKKHYGGPCPPSGTHRYFFKVFALDRLIDLNSESNKIQLEKAMTPHVIGFGQLIGLYQKNGQ